MISYCAHTRGINKTCKHAVLIFSWEGGGTILKRVGCRFCFCFYWTENWRTGCRGVFRCGANRVSIDCGMALEYSWTFCHFRICLHSFRDLAVGFDVLDGLDSRLNAQ